MRAGGTAGREKESYVRSLFDSIAGRYDLMNRVMTGGLLAAWHRAFARLTGLGPGDPALDVCCGTGDLALVMAGQVGPRGRVVGLDFSWRMLLAGRARITRQDLDGRIHLVAGNALALPFAEATFACAAIGFALRNVADIEACLAEMARVVRPGGRVVALEISRPPNPVVRAAFWLYFGRIVPWLGRLAEGWRLPDPRLRRLRPYTYLPRSLATLPDQAGLAALMRRVGLRDVGYLGLSGGVVTLHFGTRPGEVG